MINLRFPDLQILFTDLWQKCRFIRESYYHSKMVPDKYR